MFVGAKLRNEVGGQRRPDGGLCWGRVRGGRDMEVVAAGDESPLNRHNTHLKSYESYGVFYYFLIFGLTCKNLPYTYFL